MAAARDVFPEIGAQIFYRVEDKPREPIDCEVDQKNSRKRTQRGEAATSVPDMGSD